MKIEKLKLSLEKLKSKIQSIQKEWIETYGDQVGSDLAKKVRVRTRLGKSVQEEGASPSKLKELKSSTIRFRKFYEDELSELTRPKKSNLTATGQMLDSITHKIENNSIVLYFQGKRTKELGRKKRSKLTNEEVAKFVSKDRPFFHLSKTEKQALSRQIKSDLLKILRNK